MHPYNPPACPLPGSACPTALSGVTATSPQPQRGAEKPNASPLHIPLHLGCPNHNPPPPPEPDPDPTETSSKKFPLLFPVFQPPPAPLDLENRLHFSDHQGDAHSQPWIMLQGALPDTRENHAQPHRTIARPEALCSRASSPQQL